MGLQKKLNLLIYLAVCLALPVLLLAPGTAQAETDKRVKKWEKTYGKHDKVICVSIPKAGTHLLVKCLTLLGIEGISYNYDTSKIITERMPRPWKKITSDEYGERAFSRLTYRINKNKHIRRSYLIHLPFHKNYNFFFDTFTEANFLMIRDPRDQLISLAATSLKDPLNREMYLHETLLDLIKGENKHVPWERRHGACDLMWTLGPVKFYKSFLKWTENPKFMVVRFENLVGPQGGGTLEAQMNEIRNIGRHLGVEFTDEQIIEVADNLYGDTRTFKKGQLNAWKKYYTPEIKQAFKNVPGACQLLIDLGYEQDCDW